VNGNRPLAVIELTRVPGVPTSRGLDIPVLKTIATTGGRLPMLRQVTVEVTLM
jgi:hypothetical protein